MHAIKYKEGGLAEDMGYQRVWAMAEAIMVTGTELGRKIEQEEEKDEAEKCS